MTSTVIESVTDHTHQLIELTHSLLRRCDDAQSEDLLRSQLGILYTQLELLEPTVAAVDDVRVKLSSLSL